MRKVYIVTSGQWDEYRIEAIFSDRKSAERYCALIPDNTQVDERCRVEEYEVKVDKDTDEYTVYRSAWFYLCNRHNTPRFDYHIVYSKYPFEKEVEVIYHPYDIRGVIPLDDDKMYGYDDIYDMACKEFDKLKELYNHEN